MGEYPSAHGNEVQRPCQKENKHNNMRASAVGLVDEEDAKSSDCDCQSIPLSLQDPRELREATAARQVHLF